MILNIPDLVCKPLYTYYRQFSKLLISQNLLMSHCHLKHIKHIRIQVQTDNTPHKSKTAIFYIKMVKSQDWHGWKLQLDLCHLTVCFLIMKSTFFFILSRFRTSQRRCSCTQFLLCKVFSAPFPCPEEITCRTRLGELCPTVTHTHWTSSPKSTHTCYVSTGGPLVADCDWFTMVKKEERV